MLVQRVAHVAVLNARLDLDRAPRIRRCDLLRDAAQECHVLVEQVVFEVADDEAQLDLGRVAVHEHRMHVTLALLRRLR